MKFLRWFYRWLFDRSDPHHVTDEWRRDHRYDKSGY